MIDIHTHILPAVDDGAADRDEALAMARAAVADGIATLVATPHSWSNGATEHAVHEQVQALQRALEAAGIALHLVAGSEVWLMPDMAEERRAGRAFTVNRGPYMLVELPLHQIPTYVEQSIFALQVAGVKPVLVHPERCTPFGHDLEPLYVLVSRGVLGQVTAGSLLGAFGPKAKELAEIMLEHHLVHVIASDAHCAAHRPPVLSAAVKRAAELVGEQRALAMVTTVPWSIVAGEPIEVPEPLPYRAKRRWFSWGG